MQIMKQFSFIIDHAKRSKKLTSIYSITGGRASGKTHNIISGIITHTLMVGDDVLFMRWTQKSIKQSSYSEIINQIKNNNLLEKFKITNTYIRSKNTKATIEFRGAYGQEDAIRSLSSSYKVIILEEAQEFSEEMLQIILDTILRFDNLLLIVSYNISTIHNPAYRFFHLDDDPNITKIFLTYKDNKYLSQAMEKQRLKSKRLLSEDDYLMHWEGIPKASVDNCLFTQELINKCMTDEDCYIPNKFEKVIVAFDPAVSNISISEKTKSNSNGIAVIGLKNKIAYLLDGYCEVSNTLTAIQILRDMYNYWRADYVIYERNQGGDWIKDFILGFDNSLNVKGYTSTESKVGRASKILPQIEFDRVKVVCNKSVSDKLFNQAKRMTTTGFHKLFKNESPDLLDAFVIGIIEVLDIEKVGTANFLLPQAEDLSHYFYDKRVMVALKEKGYIYSMDCLIVSKDSTYGLVINEISQTPSVAFEIQKEFDLLLTNSQDISGFQICHQTLLIENFDKTINLLDYLKPVDIKDNTMRDFWDRYDGVENDNQFLQMALKVMSLLTN